MVFWWMKGGFQWMLSRGMSFLLLDGASRVRLGGPWRLACQMAVCVAVEAFFRGTAHGHVRIRLIT
jgi:hypothetical protein